MKAQTFYRKIPWIKEAWELRKKSTECSFCAQLNTYNSIEQKIRTKVKRFIQISNRDPTLWIQKKRPTETQMLKNKIECIEKQKTTKQITGPVKSE